MPKLPESHTDNPAYGRIYDVVARLHQMDFDNNGYSEPLSDPSETLADEEALIAELLREGMPFHQYEHLRYHAKAEAERVGQDLSQL